MRTTARSPAKKRRSRSSASAASSSGSTQTSGRFESWTSWESAYPRAAPMSPRACTLRTPPRMAASNSARAVGLPFGRAAKGEVVDAVGSKAHDRLRASLRGAGGLCNGRGVSDQTPSTPTFLPEVVEPGPAREGAGLTQLGELDVTAADHPADLGETHLLAQRLQIPARDAEEEGVVFASGEGQVQPVAQTAGGGSQRERCIRRWRRPRSRRTGAPGPGGSRR